MSLAPASPRRRMILQIFAILTMLMLLFPPFRIINSSQVEYNLGYGFLFAPPTFFDTGVAGSINLPVLIVQWIALAACFAIAYVLSPATAPRTLSFGDAPPPDLPPLYTAHASRVPPPPPAAPARTWRTGAKWLLRVGMLVGVSLAIGIVRGITQDVGGGVEAQAMQILLLAAVVGGAAYTWFRVSHWR